MTDRLAQYAVAQRNYRSECLNAIRLGRSIARVATPMSEDWMKAAPSGVLRIWSEGDDPDPTVRFGHHSWPDDGRMKDQFDKVGKAWGDLERLHRGMDEDEQKCVVSPTEIHERCVREAADEAAASRTRW